MCEFCVKHGAGRKWYLNASNFVLEKLEDRRAVLEWNVEYFRNVERNASVRIKWAVDLVNTPGLGSLVRLVGDRRFPRQGAEPPYGFVCQVLPLAEARLVAKLAQRIVCVPCACRRMARGVEEETCMLFDVAGDGAGRFPEFRPSRGETLSSEQTVELLGRFDEKGYVHAVWFHPIPYVGAICNCAYPFCQQLKLRRDYRFRTVLKGEYVASVNAGTCTGCGRCPPRCQFDAIRLVDGRARVEAAMCFGCGLCQAACESDAIRLLPRGTVKRAADLW